jgi:hypothetical protein
MIHCETTTFLAGNGDLFKKKKKVRDSLIKVKISEVARDPPPTSTGSLVQACSNSRMIIQSLLLTTLLVGLVEGLPGMVP